MHPMETTETVTRAIPITTVAKSPTLPQVGDEERKHPATKAASTETTNGQIVDTIQLTKAILLSNPNPTTTTTKVAEIVPAADKTTTTTTVRANARNTAPIPAPAWYHPAHSVANPTAKLALVENYPI